LTAVPIGLTFLSFVVNSSDVVAFFHLVTYFFFLASWPSLCVCIAILSISDYYNLGVQ
jgi:hypothetical protein